MNKKALKNAGVALVLVTLFSVVFVSLPTQRVMATMTISVNPTSGVVGDTVTVNGTIDTSDGFFTVRWNQTLNVTTGQAVGFNATTSFQVPQTVGAPSGRNVTVELIDDAFGAVATANFTLYTELHMLVEAPELPKQFQEGSTVPIVVNITGGEANTAYVANITVRDPANQTFFSHPLLSNTTTTGYGEANRTYPTDFGAAAHTNSTGKFVVAFNNSVTKEFFIGLTDMLEYRRNETVQVEAAGYHPSEIVTVDIKAGAYAVAGFPKNVTATLGGTVTLSWKIPLNATPGTYSLTVANSTSEGTVKTPPDAQNFEVLGVVCKIQATNLANESVESALVEVYNATTPNVLLLNGYTNATGWIRFNLESGEYNFKAFVKSVEVGSLSNQNVTVDTELDLQLTLVNVVATVKNETGEGVPFIDIALKHNYTTRDNNTVSETLSLRTNLTGMGELHNLFTNTTYKVEARRSGMLFNSTTLSVEPSPALPWLSLNLTLPNYRLNVHALDSESKPADEIQINIYDWASGVTAPLQSDETKGGGNASFLLPFGRYLIRAFKGDVFLNETAVNLIENPLTFTLHLVTVNVGVTVSVFDYFGQPIANAKVEIERKINQDFVPVDSRFTVTGGYAEFALTVGGDSRISVYVAGRLAAVKTEFLGTGSNQVTFNIGEYVAVLGYPIETGLFALFSFLILIAAIVLVLARRRLMRSIRSKLKR